MVHAILFSFSRGGMLGLIVLGLASLRRHAQGAEGVPGFRFGCGYRALPSPVQEVRARFGTSFADKEHRDASAESRVELWAACWDTMLKHPVLGVGPDHMPLVIDQYGFREGQGSPYALASARGRARVSRDAPADVLLRRLSRPALAHRSGKTAVADPWLTYLARMVIASLVGFAVSAQFVSLEFLEPPYYIALVGAGVLMLSDRSLPPVQDSEAQVGQLDRRFGPGRFRLGQRSWSDPYLIFCS